MSTVDAFGEYHSQGMDSGSNVGGTGDNHNVIKGRKLATTTTPDTMLGDYQKCRRDSRVY